MTSKDGRKFLHLGLVNVFVNRTPNSEAIKENIYIKCFLRSETALAD